MRGERRETRATEDVQVETPEKGKSRQNLEDTHGQRKGGQGEALEQGKGNKERNNSRERKTRRETIAGKGNKERNYSEERKQGEKL